ncbi:MAG: hypothetical protein U0441_16415 [Polyangiaceae bacterium]
MKKLSSSVVLFTSLGIAALSGAALSTAGCGGGSGGSGGGGGGTATCPDYSKFDGTMPVVSFKTDVLPVFQRSCGLSTSCHGDPNMPSQDRPYFGPNKSTTATADDISKILAGSVGVSSYLNPSMQIVKVSDPEHSFLMYKLDDQLECATLECAATNACGGLMPQGATEPLASDERDAIRRWIAQGAQNN